MTGADGQPDLEHFYRDVVRRICPVISDSPDAHGPWIAFHLVDELTVSFLHD